MRNALLPQVTSLAIALGTAASGSVLVEVAFNYPGIGYLLYNALRSSDYFLVQGIAFFLAKGEKYKAELIRDLPQSETITLYRQGDWIDLCRGPHMRGTGDVGTAFKLMKVAGAYWRGDHRNAMLSPASVTSVAGTLPAASRRTTRQSTVPRQPCTPVPTALVADA